jgi:hypothetical protein
MAEDLFLQRLLLLLLLGGVFVLLDLRKPPAERRRLREYSFILAVAGVGAVFGAVNDYFTCTLSPEYFIINKGLLEGPDLRLTAMALGAKAGFAGGAIGAALLLYLSGAQRRPWANYWLYLLPFAAGWLTGIGFGVFRWHVDWPRVYDFVNDALTPELQRRFYTVWCEHLGVYLGAMVALIGVIFRARKIGKQEIQKPPA